MRSVTEICVLANEKRNNMNELESLLAEVKNNKEKYKPENFNFIVEQIEEKITDLKGRWEVQKLMQGD